MSHFRVRRLARVTFALAMTTIVATRVQGPALGAGPAASGTLGEGDSLSATGGAPDAIPLALPAAGGDLPVPIHIRSGAPGERGPLGVGWQIPLSTVRELDTHESFPPGLLDSPPRRVALSLLGQSFDMRLFETDGELAKFHPFTGDRSIELIEDASDGSFRAHDGAGRTYWFEVDPRMPPQGHDTLLLTQITDVTGEHRVELRYAILERLGGLGVEVLLDQVSYSFAPGTDCPKYSVSFDYVDPFGEPFAARAGGNLFWTHQNLVASVQVDASADATCSDRRTIAAHEFTYETDPASGVPLLRSVDSSGLDWQAPLRQATYSYGSAIQDGWLRYEKAHQIPTTFLPKALRGSFGSTLEVGQEAAVTLSLRDFTGDGRPDLFFAADGAAELKLAPHAFSGFGEHTLGATPQTFIDSLPTGHARLGRGAILDWNGDGRADFIDSDGEGSWKVYLNTPGASPGDAVFQSFPVAAPFYREYPIDEATQQACANNDLPPGPEPEEDDGDVDESWGVQDDIPSSDCGPSGEFAAPSMGFTSWTKAQMRCFEYALDATTGQYVRRACAAQPDPWTERTLWNVRTATLQDVNGDGYPDYVYTSRGAERRGPKTPPGVGCSETCPAAVSSPTAVPSGCDGACYDDFWGSSYELPDDTQIHVLLHAGPAAARPGASGEAFLASDILLDDGACGVERTMTRRERKYSELTCGFRDVNGDGRLDWVDGSHRGAPFSSYAHVSLGNGTLGWDTFSEPQLDLPGPIELAYDHSDACIGDPDAEYEVLRVSDLVDLTGDGIPDYVFGGSPDLGPELGELDDLNFFVRKGTGLGFGDPVPIALADGAQFTISQEVQTCGNLPSTRLLAGLIDFDGDGRVELVRAQELHLDVWSPSAEGSVAGSIVDEDRIVRVDGPTGVSKLLRYASAKDDPVLAHQTPSPEIVLHRIETLVTGPLDGDPPAPVELAYGDSALHFHPGAQRFVPAGYGIQSMWTVVPATDKSGQPVRLGRASISRAVRPGDYAGFPGVVLTGSPLQSEHLAGEFSEGTAWDLLYGAASAAHPLTRGGSLHEKEVHAIDYAWPSAVTEGCMLVDPYGSGLADPTPCTTHLVAYDARTLQWEGDALPQAGAENVQSAVQTLEVDDLGRPTLTRNEGDVFDPNDDVCTTVTYATPDAPSFERDHAANTPALTQVGDCKGHPLATSYVEYDGLPLGTVSRGLPTRTWADVHRTSDGALVSVGEVVVLQRNERGLVTASTIETSYGGDVQAKTTTVERDAFELVTVSTDTTGSDVAVSIHTEIEVDPYRLLPTRRVEHDGSASVVVYDARGRAVSSATVRSGQSYFLTATEYLGEDGSDPLGQRVRTRVAADLIPWDPDTAALGADGLPLPPPDGLAGIDEQTAYLDAMGRTRFSLKPLGVDYGGEVQRLGFVERDAFGRPRYSVPVSLLSEDVHAARGTTHLYDVRGRVSCVVEGDGPQTTTTPSVALGVLPSCMDYQYLGHRLHTGAAGPEELTPGSASYQARDVTVTTGAGRAVETFRAQSGVTLAHARFTYDPLGNLTHTRRAVSPELATTTWVEWRSEVDARGRALTTFEPGAVPVHSEYDSVGRLCRTWFDESVNGVVTRRETLGTFDSLGRVTGSTTTRLSGGQLVVESSSELIYDEPCDGSLHSADDHLSGRLACSLSTQTGADDGLAGSTATWFAYDDVGNQVRTHRLGPSGEILTELTDPGLARLQSYGFDLPDQGGKTERALFQYDSAGQVSQVTLSDGELSEIVMKASYDARQRPVSVLHGNGVVEQLEYRQSGRRELVGRRIDGAAWSYEWTSLASDAEGRTLEEKVRAPDGAEHFRKYELDARDHLVERLVTSAGQVVEHERFAYDALGNIRWQGDAIAGTYRHHQRDAMDPDRLCSVVATLSPSTPPPAACDYVYGPRGEVVTTPELELAYDAAGKASRVWRGAHEVSWREGPEGRAEVEEVAADGTLVRHEHMVGPSLSYVVDPNGELVLERRFGGPFGLMFTKRGPGKKAPRLYAHGAGHANALFTSQDGEVKQYLEYAAYGAVTLDTGDEDSGEYRHDQFNGGTLFAQLGFQEIGARLLDPTLGRFLQRDPIVRPRRASSMNPYSFASNDPINHSDPTGFDDEAVDWKQVDGVTLPFLGTSLGNDYWVRRSPVDGSMQGRVLGHEWWSVDQVEVNDKRAPTLDVTIVLPILREPPGVSEKVSDLVPAGRDLVFVPNLLPDGSIDGAELRDRILRTISERSVAGTKIGTLYHIGHGGPGHPTLGVDDPRNNGLEPIRLLLPHIVEGLVYQSCNVAYGDAGEAYLQYAADTAGVPVTAVTAFSIPKGDAFDGVVITRYPGQSFSRSEVLARQIESHLMTPDRVYGGYLISNLRIAESLMQRAELDPTLIMGVYARIVGSPEWEKVLERMNFLQEPERAVFWNKRFRAVGVANPRGLNVIVD